MSVSARWWRYAERVQASLPVLAAAGLAGFTWWLVQSSPKESGPTQPSRVASAPDYEMRQARVVRFDAAGRLEAVVDGRLMRHYPDTDRLVIDEVLLLGRDEKGQGLRATARQGEADQRTEVLTLRGGARVEATPPVDKQAGVMHFDSESLRVDTRLRLVSSSHPVTLSQDGNVLRGQTLRHDERKGLTLIGGRVTGVYQAPSQ